MKHNVHSEVTYHHGSHSLECPHMQPRETHMSSSCVSQGMQGCAWWNAPCRRKMWTYSTDPRYCEWLLYCVLAALESLLATVIHTNNNTDNTQTVYVHDKCQSLLLVKSDHTYCLGLVMIAHTPNAIFNHKHLNAVHESVCLLLYHQWTNDNAIRFYYHDINNGYVHR